MRSAIKLEQENRALGAGDSPSVHSLETDSSRLVGTALAPLVDAATMTSELFSNQDRQRRLTSLLHRLTIDGGAPERQLPMNTALPALWVGEPSQMRPMRADRARTGLRFAWLFVLAGVTGGLVGWGTILDLPTLVRYSLPQKTELPVAADLQSAKEVPLQVHTNLSQENTEPPASVQSKIGVPPLVHDSLSQQTTESPVAANVQSSTGAPRLIHDSLPQQNSELPVAAHVESATEARRLVHDSPPQQNTELPFAAREQSTTEAPAPMYDSLPQNAERPVAAHLQSTTEAPAPMHDGLPQENTERPVAANVQSTEVSLVRDSLPKDNKPPLRTLETSSVQTQKHHPLAPDTDEIAALVKRGEDFAAHGDLISARLLLQRAAEAGGSAEAALALGETFDPLVFQRLGVIGIKPDAASARKWYERAAELGSPIASQYLAKSDSAP
jgi:hypothetical protein